MNYRQFFQFLLIVITTGLVPQTAKSQMFSVKPEKNYIGMPDVAVYAGTEFINFRFKGDPQEITPGSDYSADNVAFRVGIETGGFSIYAVYGRNLGASSSTSITIIGGDLNTEFYLLRRSWISFYAPFQVGSVYMLAQNNEQAFSPEEFSQNAVYIGTGLGVLGRFSERFRFSIAGIGSYGFSTSGVYGTGGNVSQVRATGRLYIDNIFRGFGIIAGTDVMSRNYRMELEQFKYIYGGTSVVLGVTF